MCIIISRKSKRKLKENMTLRLTLELQTFLSLKKDTLPRLLHPAPIERNLKIKQDTSSLQTSSKLPFQSRRETQGLLIIIFSPSTVPLTQGEAAASTVSPRSDEEWDVRSTSYVSGGRALPEGWSLSHDSEHKCKPAYCRMSEDSQQWSVRHRTCSSAALP